MASARMSELRAFRGIRLLALGVAIAADVAIVASDPSASAGSSVAIVVIVVLAFLIPILVQMHVVGSAEALLDRSCDPAALARRGDGMGLSGRIPRNGLFRTEAVLLHRYGLALLEVGRAHDAAEVRRRMEEGLAMRRKPASSADCPVMSMCLADLCARLGDAEAAAAYAGQFREGMGLLPESSLKGADKDLGLVGRVTLSSSLALFLPAGVQPDYSGKDVAALEVGGGRRRLASEARMALAADARGRGEHDRERELLERVASDAPGLRVGRLAASMLTIADDTGEPVGYGTLRLAEPVDPHPAISVRYSEGKR